MPIQPGDSPDYLHAVCDNATVALFVMDERQHCVYMNMSAERLTGYTLAEVQGRPLHDFVHHTHPDGRPYPLEDCPIDRAAPQNMREQGEEVFVHKDGHFYPVAFTASPIRRGSDVMGTVIEVRELTGQHARAQENVAIRELGELMLEELDLGRVVQAVTDTATRLSGAEFGAFFYNSVDEGGDAYMLYALSGVAAENFSKFPHPRPTPMFGPTFRGEGTIRLDDVTTSPSYGKWGPHHGMPAGHLPVRSYLALPVKSDTGEVLGGLFLGHGRPAVFTEHHARIVESIAAQAAVGMSRLQLIRALEREARETDRLYREAQAASEMKDRFLATISHELRTPLTSILGWSEMLASGRLAPEMATRAVQTIDRNARAQAQIIEDLLDISRIVSGKLHLDVRAFAVAQPVEAAVEAVRPAALARDVHLAIDIAPDAGSIDGDPDRLQQVIWNLVANAVKFTDRGGRVEIVVRRVTEHVEIQVRDNGRGVQPEFLPFLFDRFTQVDHSGTHEHRGLGLGLSIARQLVQLHGGDITVESRGLGHGATFTVVLPFAYARSTTAPALGAASSSDHPASLPPLDALSGCRILLVEDDADAREMLASVLLAHGAQVHASASAVEGLESIDGFSPTVVVSDIGMPGLDGYAFVRALRDRESQAGTSRVPAVALTAYARDEDRRHALAEGFDLHLSKPVHPADLVMHLCTVCGARDAGDAAA